MTGNDDPPELHDYLNESPVLTDPEDQLIDLGDGFTMTSCGWSNRTPGLHRLPVDRVVLVQLEVPLPAVSAAIRAAAMAEDTRVVLKPAPARPLPPELTDLVDVIVPNQAELARLGGGEIAGLADTVRIASALPGHSDVIVTLGKDGALVVPRSGSPAVIAAPLVDVVDTTGAGDCFCGTLAVTLADGMRLTEAARWSVAAAALSTTGRGA